MPFAELQTSLLEPRAAVSRSAGGSDGGDLEDGGSDAPSLCRTLTRWDGISLTVGLIIGSGVFTSPGVVFREANDALLGLSCWLFAACLAALSALCYAELSTCLPTAGGDFDYLTVAFGERAAFLWAWVTFWVIKGGGQAVLGLTFGQHVCATLPAHLCGAAPDAAVSERAAGAALIIFLVAVNSTGLRLGATLQHLTGIVKAALVLFLLALAAVAAALQPALPHAVPPPPPLLATPLRTDWRAELAPRIGGVATSVVAAMWAYDGWSGVTFLAEECLSPAADLPVMILGGLAVVTAVYMALNCAYVVVLGTQAAAATDTVAVVLAERAAALLAPRLPGVARVLQSTAPRAVAAGVALSVAGTLNGSVMTGGRYLFAGARSGQLPAVLMRVHSQSSAPWVALVAQGAWACALLAMPSEQQNALESLLSFTGGAAWLAYAAVAAALMRLRTSEPHLPRSFRVPLYPMTPVAVVLLGVALAAGTAVREPVAAAAVLAVLLSGSLLHALCCCGKGRRRLPSRASSRATLSRSSSSAVLAAEPALARLGSAASLAATLPPPLDAQ